LHLFTDSSVESKESSTISLQAAEKTQDKNKLKLQPIENLRLSQQGRIIKSFNLSNNLSIQSEIQIDLSAGLESPQSVASDLPTVVTFSVNNSGANSSNAAAGVIIEALKNENREMRSEIMVKNFYYQRVSSSQNPFSLENIKELRKRVSKVNQLEEDMSKVHQAYQVSELNSV